MDLDSPAAADDDGQVSRGSWMMPSSSSSGSSLEDLARDDEERRQRDSLYQLECAARKRMYMTTMEKHQLEDVLKRKYDSGQPELVLNLFGRPEGRAVTKQVYCDMVQTQRYSHSQGISIIVQEFTLAKSLLLSSRAMQPTPPAGQECYCFPRTAILPSGCYHRLVSQGQVPLPSKKTSPWHCSVCSQCFRCGQNFGLV